MAVRKLANGKWQVDVSVGWKTVVEAGPGGEPVTRTYRDRRKKVCATKAEAKRAEAMLMAAKQQEAGASCEMTLSAFIEFMYWPAKQNLRPNTRMGYERDIRLRILPELGGMPIGKINSMHIQRMINGCETKKVATNAKQTLSSILGVAVSMRVIDSNPAAGRFVYPRAGQKPAGEGYGDWVSSYAEQKRLIGLARGMDPGGAVERILVLGFCFGLRKGEILGLDWERVDMEGRRIEVVQTYVMGAGGSSLEEPKTARSRRSVPIVGYAAEAMSRWSRGGEDEDIYGRTAHPVVTAEGGGRLHPTAAKRAVQRFRNGVAEDIPEITMYSLRHSFATAAVRQGVPISTISTWLGHERISTTYDRYVRTLAGDADGDAWLLDSGFGS